MHHPAQEKLSVRGGAIRLAQLEPTWTAIVIDFIDHYSDLTEQELQEYRERYLSEEGEIMGLAQLLRQESRQAGRWSHYVVAIIEKTLWESAGCVACQDSQCWSGNAIELVRAGSNLRLISDLEYKPYVGLRFLQPKVLNKFYSGWNMKWVAGATKASLPQNSFGKSLSYCWNDAHNRFI
jgi:hypothetical protein